MKPLNHSRTPYRWLLAFTFTTFSACSAFEYHLAIDQPIGTSWNNLASWRTNPDGTGSSPASMSTHAFFTNNHGLRANQTSFGGAALTLNGGSISLKTDLAGQTATIGTLTSSGGTILQANAYTTNTLAVTHCTLNAASTTALQASSGRGFTLALGTLSGAGSFAVGGSGTIRFTCATAEAFTGNIVVGGAGTMFHFDNAFQCRGGLIVSESAKVYLNSSIRVHKLKIKDSYLDAGTYTQAYLSATYGAQMFPAGGGSIVVASGFPGKSVTDATCVNVFQDLLPDDSDFSKWQAAGIKYIRAHYTWSEIEKTREVYNWTSCDSLFARAQARGIKVIWLLAWGNTQHENDQLSGIHTANGRAGFAQFAAAICARYTQPGTIWEIWNEQDTHEFWKVATPDNTSATAIERAEQYMDLIKATVPAMKAANPNCTVVSGGVVNIGWSVSKAWLNRAIALRLHDYVDGISVHLYGSSGSNNDPERILGQVASLRETLASNSVPASFPILATEYGATSAEETGTDEEKLLRVAEANIRMFFLTRMAGLKLNTWYVWKNYDGHSDGFAWLKWVGSSYVARPTYFAAQELWQQLDGYVFEKRLPGYASDDFVLSFSNGTNRKLVAWSIVAPHTVTVKVNSGATSFTTVSLLGATASLIATGGQISVPVSGSPQYIDLGSATVKEGALIELEDLIPVSDSGKDESIMEDVLYSNDALAYYPATAAGDFVSYNIPVPEAGTYVVKVRFKKHSSRGRFQLYIDDAAQGAAQDEYAASVTPAEVNLGPKAFGSGGNKVFRFTVPVPGKHTNSSGYGLSFDYIQLLPQ